MLNFTFCSFKGGTAKTSVAMHIGACLAKYHQKRVLLIDFDSQANLSIGLGVGSDLLKTMVPVLKGEENIASAIQKTSIDGLYLIPANAYLDGIERIPPLVNDPYAHERLRRSLKSLEDDFDFCFIDIPPSLGWLTQSAFFASDYSIICAMTEAYSVIGLRRLKDFHEHIQQHHNINMFGVILSFWDERGAANKTFLDEINHSFPNQLFLSKIRRDVAVSRAVLTGVPVIEFEESSRASQDYKAVSEEFLARLPHVESVKKYTTNQFIDKQVITVN